MQSEIWLTMFAAALAVSASPGAGAVVSMNYGLRYGLKRSYPLIMGLQLGYMIQAFVVIIGLGAVIAKSAILFTVVKWAGVAYLLYLAVMKLLETPQNPKASQGTRRYDAKHAFVSGTVINLTNIKATVFLVAFIPQFLDPGKPLPAQFFIIAVTLCAVDIFVMSGYSTMAARLQFLVRDAKAMRVQNRITAVLLVIAAVFMSTAKRG